MEIMSTMPAEPQPAMASSASATLRSLSGDLASKSPEAIDEAAREFESYFVQFTLQEMRKSIPHSDLFEDRQTMGLIESMFDETIAQSIAEGRGIGLADQLRRLMLGDQADMPTQESIGSLLPPSRSPDSWMDAVRVTSKFGPRIHPIRGGLDDHPGVDIGLPEGTAIRATSGGTVTFVGERGGYGNLVIIDHGNGYTSRYAHNSRLLVEPGERVEAGQLIAESGNSGSSTGSHLHFEIRKLERPVDPADVSWSRCPVEIP